MKFKKVLIITVMIAGLFAGGGLLHQATHPQLEASVVPTPVRPITVEADEKQPAPEPSRSTEPPTPDPALPPTLEIASAGFLAPLEYISAEDGAITPPGFDRAYVVEGFSAPLTEPDTGSIIAVFHSVRGGASGLGNKLFNQQTGTPTLEPGTSITIAGHTYVFKAAEAVLKDDLPNRADIWASHPNRLILITCLQNPEGKPSTQNFVLTAERTP